MRSTGDLTADWGGYVSHRPTRAQSRPQSKVAVTRVPLPLRHQPAATDEEITLKVTDLLYQEKPEEHKQSRVEEKKRKQQQELLMHLKREIDNPALEFDQLLKEGSDPQVYLYYYQQSLDRIMNKLNEYCQDTEDRQKHNSSSEVNQLSDPSRRSSHQQVKDQPQGGPITNKQKRDSFFGDREPIILLEPVEESVDVDGQVGETYQDVSKPTGRRKPPQTHFEKTILSQIEQMDREVNPVIASFDREISRLETTQLEIDFGKCLKAQADRLTFDEIQFLQDVEVPHYPVLRASRPAGRSITSRHFSCGLDGDYQPLHEEIT